MNMELMGIYEIAQLAGVSPQAVSNWVVRKPDFPKPVATLASGPIWNGQHIRTWLVQADYTPPQIAKKGREMDFKKDQEYTLDEISSVLGGETQSYLPQRGGKIVCGRFSRKMNPDAPTTILAGDLPQVRRKAELVAEQKEPIPVFIKEQATRAIWRYHGLMRCVSFDTDPALCEKLAQEAERTDKLAGVLSFEDIN
jgi:hypothetical protein